MTRIHSKAYKAYYEEDLERMLRKVRHRLSIWDRRDVVQRSFYGDWAVLTLPTEQDRTVTAEDLRLLFGRDLDH